jgi:hypothetical protein
MIVTIAVREDVQTAAVTNLSPKVTDLTRDISATARPPITRSVELRVAIPSAPGFIATHQWFDLTTLGLVRVWTDKALAFAMRMHPVRYVPTLLVRAALRLRGGLGSVRTVSEGALRAQEAVDA